MEQCIPKEIITLNCRFQNPLPSEHSSILFIMLIDPLLIHIDASYCWWYGFRMAIHGNLIRIQRLPIHNTKYWISLNILYSLLWWWSPLKIKYIQIKQTTHNNWSKVKMLNCWLLKGRLAPFHPCKFLLQGLSLKSLLEFWSPLWDSPAYSLVLAMSFYSHWWL